MYGQIRTRRDEQFQRNAASSLLDVAVRRERTHEKQMHRLKHGLMNTACIDDEVAYIVSM
jgi:hypothetical protein